MEAGLKEVIVILNFKKDLRVALPEVSSRPPNERHLFGTIDGKTCYVFPTYNPGVESEQFLRKLMEQGNQAWGEVESARMLERIV
jgi:hypothetical protein